MTRTLDIWWDGRLVGQLTHMVNSASSMRRFGSTMRRRCPYPLAAKAGGAVQSPGVSPVFRWVTAGRKPTRCCGSGARRVASQ